MSIFFPSKPTISDSDMAKMIMDDITQTKANPKLTANMPLYIGGSGGGAGGGTSIFGGSNGAGSIWSTSTVTASSTMPPMGNLSLPADGDIKFGNNSLKDFMESVSMRLALLVPNPKLEAEWEELKTLGEAYRALEKDLTEKSKTWDILKRT